MRKFGILGLALLFLAFGVSGASATALLYDWAFYVDGTTYEDLLGDTMPTSGSLDSEGLGTLTWTTSSAGTHNFIGFFDHEIDEAINTFFNEYGDTVNTPDVVQSWEIDEPGYVFGDIYANLLAGSLDNTNGVPQPTPDDVSWAMGWDFSLVAGETATISLILSGTAPSSGFYLTQTDPDSNETIYYSSSLETVPSSIPDAATVFLLGSAGLVGALGLRRRRVRG